MITINGYMLLGFFAADDDDDVSNNVDYVEEHLSSEVEIPSLW